MTELLQAMGWVVAILLTGAATIGLLLGVVYMFCEFFYTRDLSQRNQERIWKIQEQLAERNAAKAEIKRLREVQLGDAAEFNRGCDAALAGGPPVEPDDCPYDSWKCGYAWGYWMRHPELGQAAAEAAGGEK